MVVVAPALTMHANSGAKEQQRQRAAVLKGSSASGLRWQRAELAEGCGTSRLR
jgi:hypothetical protein